MQLPTEKGPGPDGYIGAIYMSCWNIIRADLVAAIRHIFFVRNKTLGRMTLGVEKIFGLFLTLYHNFMPSKRLGIHTYRLLAS
jgi:hypothetical protein